MKNANVDTQDDEHAIAEILIEDAVAATHPSANPRMTKIVNEIYDDYAHKASNTLAELATNFDDPFRIKFGKDDDLLKKFDDFEAVKLKTKHASGYEEIYKKAILWAHLIQVEEKKLDIELANEPTFVQAKAEEKTEIRKKRLTDVASIAYDEAFIPKDITRMRIPVKNFLNEYWDGDISLIEETLEKKATDYRAQFKLHILGGIKDKACKYVDIQEQSR